eukprot:Platyproteum_vivax@DN5542_c0_g1_i1.p1
MGNKGCKPDPWGQWSKCSLDCWDGKTTAEQKRTREKACPNGKAEQKKKEETRECPINRTKITCPTACNPISEWSDWTKCTKTCDGGVQTRSRKVENGLNGGERCSDKDRNEERKCNADECAKDCVLGRPSKWSDCSVSCGSGGKRTQGRALVVKPNKGGKPCREVEPKDEAWSCDMSEQVDGICMQRSDNCPDNPKCKEFGVPDALPPGATPPGAQVQGAKVPGAPGAPGLPGTPAIPNGQANAAYGNQLSPFVCFILLLLLLFKMLRHA